MMTLYIDRVIADIEIINIIENALRKDVDTFLDMKLLDPAYNNLFRKWRKIWLQLLKVHKITSILKSK